MEGGKTYPVCTSSENMSSKASQCSGVFYEMTNTLIVGGVTTTTVIMTTTYRYMVHKWCFIYLCESLVF